MDVRLQLGRPRPGLFCARVKLTNGNINVAARDFCLRGLYDSSTLIPLSSSRLLGGIVCIQFQIILAKVLALKYIPIGNVKFLGRESDGSLYLTKRNRYGFIDCWSCWDFK